MNNQSNIAMHKKGHEAFNEGDTDALADVIAEDTVWHWSGRNPFAGDHQGRDAVLQQFGGMAEATGGDMEIKDVDYLANDSKTSAVFRFTASREDSQMNVLVCEVVEWRDGKVAEEWTLIHDQYAYDDFWS